MHVVIVKKGHVKPVWAGHPWIYAQAVGPSIGEIPPGTEVKVLDPQRRFLGYGLCSNNAAIPVRIYSRNEAQRIDAQLFDSLLSSAVRRRKALGLPNRQTDAFRLVHGEGDELPGLVVDCFGDVLAVQFGTIALHARRALIFDSLERITGAKTILDKTSRSVAEREGFAPDALIQRGDERLGALTFQERGIRFEIPLELGQKTGFYLDQRPLRGLIESIAKGQAVLDLFCYVGASALAAARGGARSVVAVDTSGPALQVAGQTAHHNSLDTSVQFCRADALNYLERLENVGSFDLVICDPPKLTPRHAQLGRALSMLRRLTALASRALRPHGRLIISSCSAALGIAELTRAVALGGRDVNRRPIVLERVFQGPDHPVLAACPESGYLSSLLLEVP